MSTSTQAVVDCPLVEISGQPRERGRQYGEQARARILRGIEHYSAQLEANHLPWPEIRAIVQAYEPTITSFEASYIDEMKGIAEGADVEYAAIVLLNARTEILKIAERRRKGLPVNLEPDGCTGVVILPSATATGRLLQAQNWDWKAECAETAIVLKVRRDDGPDLLTFTEAGALARSGMNSAGIALTGNYLESDRDYKKIGMPLALLRRKALEQKRLALAMRIVYTTQKSASNNLIVSHADGIAIDFECAPDETFQVHAQRGLIVHANHWQSPVALSKLKETGIVAMPDSLYRDMRVRELLERNLGSLTRQHLKDAMFDEFQTPWSVCRPPRPGIATNLSATVAMIVMEPALGVMEVTMLPALNHRCVEYRLEMDEATANARLSAEVI